MTPFILGAVAVAIVAVVIGALLLRRRRPAPIDTPEEAADAAEQALTGFVAADAVVGVDGQGALAIGTDGRIVAIRRQGRHVAVREVAWAAVRATGRGVIVETGERRMGEMVLAGVDALDVRRLAEAGRRAA